MSCTYHHPALPIVVNNHSYFLYGSSCITPTIQDADIYISLDKQTPGFDWEAPWYRNKQEHVRFFIRDRGLPEDEEEFDLCVNYIIKNLYQNKKIHIGCIGGHGRTGILMSAVVQKMMQLQYSAIDYVRKNYCAKAVETLNQILFLESYYNIKTPINESKNIALLKSMFEDETKENIQEIINNRLLLQYRGTLHQCEKKLTSIAY